jgi:hypothetical protein
MDSLKSCFKLEKMHIFLGLGRDLKKTQLIRNDCYSLFLIDNHNDWSKW